MDVERIKKQGDLCIWYREEERDRDDDARKHVFVQEVQTQEVWKRDKGDNRNRERDDGAYIAHKDENSESRIGRGQQKKESLHSAPRRYENIPGVGVYCTSGKYRAVIEATCSSSKAHCRPKSDDMCIAHCQCCGVCA